MLTEIQLQIEEVSGVQLRVLNTLKKSGLVTTSHSLKETPDRGKVLSLVVEGDESIDEATITEIVSNITGVRSATVISQNETEVEIEPETEVDEIRRLALFVIWCLL